MVGGWWLPFPGLPHQGPSTKEWDPGPLLSDALAWGAAHLPEEVLLGNFTSVGTSFYSVLYGIPGIRWAPVGSVSSPTPGPSSLTLPGPFLPKSPTSLSQLGVCASRRPVPGWLPSHELLSVPLLGPSRIRRRMQLC